jgi:hypothetical protein
MFCFSGFAVFVSWEDIQKEPQHLKFPSNHFSPGNVKSTFDKRPAGAQQYGDYNVRYDDNVLEDSPLITRLRGDLNFANERIKILEEKLKSLDVRIPKKYPSVKFQDYQSKRRILVRINNYLYLKKKKTGYDKDNRYLLRNLKIC